MSQFPEQLDSDAQLPRVDNNVVEIGADAINALRAAMFAVEGCIGINAQGASDSIAARLNTSLDPLGNILPSALAGIGLVYLPITDFQISPTAAIQESKLSLIYPTNTLYNLYQNLKNSIDVLNGFLSLTGIKVEPHIDGTAYNHELSAILVDTSLQMLKILPGASIILPGTSIQNRNTTNADTLIKDLSDDLLIHEKANGTSGISATIGGNVPPAGFAHVAAGLFIDTSPFSVIPQTNNSLQSFAEFVDSSSLLLLGSRTQNLFSNGVSRSARSFSLTADGYGASIVPPTPIVAYLLDVPPGPIASSPVDDINHGDNVILFQPTSQQLSTFNFDAQFAQVVPGDLLTVNYNNGITAQFAIESVKAIVSGSTRTYAVRINTKNLYSTSSGMAQIDRPLYNTNKYGVLAVSRCKNQLGTLESLIVSQPRGAIALGNGFNVSLFDNSHYNLYLMVYQGGNPSNVLALPAIDITGNQGLTPGQYTLDIIVDSANTAFRAPGFNYRFIAFEYQGEFGIMLADSYNNTSFSIISGAVNNSGAYTSSSLSAYPNNVIDNYGDGINPIDPTGLGITGANLASPPASSYASVAAAQFAPTLLFYPLSKNYYYVNGVERETLRSDPEVLNQILDGYGDGYWPASILPSPATIVFANRVQVAYQINLDLATSGLEVGKSIVVQPAVPLSDSRYNFRDYGRFIIQGIAFSGCDTSNPSTIITVYDGVYGVGSSPAITSTNIPVNIYFSDDSVGFNIENIADQSSSNYPYKRFFEVLVDQNGHSFTHERARFSIISNGISNIGIYNVSPKLLGYKTAILSTEFLQAIQLSITSYNSTTGIFTGQLVNPNAPSVNFGPITTGKKGQPVRFYDETNIDYIDFIFDASSSISSWGSTESIVINLFNSLELDQENFLLSTCQVNDTTGQVSYLNDKRQFGNTSEDNFTTSAQDYIAAPTRLLSANGIIRGFDILGTDSNKIEFDGGVAVVNGKIIQVNPEIVEIPIVLEAVNANVSTTVNIITWFICVNSSSELVLVASTDYDQNGSFASIYEGLSLDNTRIFYAMNPNASSPTAYQIRGTYFADLVLNQTDLTPIAVAIATASSSSPYTITTLTSADARRYVGAGYGGMSDPFVLSANGSFRTLASVNTWLTQLNNFISGSAENNTFNPVGNTVIVKGDITVSASITLNFLNPVVFKGDGGIFVITTASGFILTNGITFDNLRFDYTHTPTGGEGYLANNLINSFNAALYCNVSTNNQNISIKNCTFNSFAVNHYPFVSFEFSGNQGVLQNVLIENNKFIDNAGVQDLRAAIAFNSKSQTLASSYPYFPKLNNVFIKDNVCNNDQMFVITAARDGVSVPAPFVACTNVRITGNTCGTIGFLTSYDIPSVNDNSSYAGLIHDKNDNIYIGQNTCKFITNLDSNGQYVSFQTIASYGPGLPGTINSALAWEPATFIVTNATNASPIQITITTSNPSIFTTGLSVTIHSVAGNTAANEYGWTITAISTTSTSATFSLNGSTGNGVYSGGGFAYVLFDIIANSTGPFTIAENTCSWIHSGTFSDINGGGDGLITKNRLYPYSPTFLQNYTDTICSVAPVNAAIVLNPDGGQSTTNSVISDNILSQKTDFTTVKINYTYDQGILSFNNATINNNYINSCVTSSSNNTNMIFMGVKNTVTKNTLTRGSSSIAAYINTAPSAIFNPSFFGNPTGIITHNIFDSIYIDESNAITNETNIAFGVFTEYNYNINQVLYAAIPVYEMSGVLLFNSIMAPGTGNEPVTTGFNVNVSINSNIQFSNTGSNVNVWCGMVNLSQYLPTGATVLNAVLGITTNTINGNNFITGDTTGQISMGLIKEPNSAINLSSLANSLADIATNSTFSSIYSYLPTSAKYILSNSTKISNMYGASVYLEINTALAAHNFTIGKDFETKIVFQSFNLQISASTVELDLAPIIIRYTFI